MKYTVNETTQVIYEVLDENGEVVEGEDGNCWDNYEEALEVKLQAEKDSEAGIPVILLGHGPLEENN